MNPESFDDGRQRQENREIELSLLRMSENELSNTESRCQSQLQGVGLSPRYFQIADFRLKSFYREFFLEPEVGLSKDRSEIDTIRFPR